MVVRILQYIKSLEYEVLDWKATCKEEDRGDGFKEGTPNYILDFRDMTLKFRYGQLRDTSIHAGNSNSLGIKKKYLGIQVGDANIL